MAVTRAAGTKRRRTATKPQPTAIDVSIEREGKLHTGSYIVDNGVITVRSRGGSIATKIGTSSVVRMAQLLLLELAAEHRRETAAMNALVISRRGEANDRSGLRRARIVTILVRPDAEEINNRLDRMQALADELMTFGQMYVGARLRVEIDAARLALKPQP